MSSKNSKKNETKSSEAEAEAERAETKTPASPPFQAPPRISAAGAAAAADSNNPTTATTAIAQGASTTSTSAAPSITSQAWMQRFAQEFGGAPPSLDGSLSQLFGSSGDANQAAASAALTALLRSTSGGTTTSSSGNAAAGNTVTAAAAAPPALSTGSIGTTGPEWLQALALSGTIHSIGLDSQLLQQQVLSMSEGGGNTTTGEEQPPKTRPANIIPMPEQTPKNKKDRIYIGDNAGLWDVKCGRGGDSNHHAGNKRYRQLVSDMKIRYRNIEAKTAKTDLSKSLVSFIESYGGRFIKMDPKNKQYYLLSKQEARRKTSQALRETKETKWLLDAGSLAGEVAKEQIKKSLGSGGGGKNDEGKENND